MICLKLNAGIGYSRGNPICVPPKVASFALELIHDYLRYYEDPDRSEEEFDLFVDEFIKKDTPTLCKLGHAAKCLQVEELVDLICDGLAENIDKNSPKVKQDFLNYFEKCAEGEELEPHKNQTGGIRIRLSKKLLAKRTKELEEVHNVKKAEAEVEAQKHEDRSIDDLISFINGEDKGSKGLKKKRNGYKGKEKKKTASSSAISSSEASGSKKVIENHEEIH
ncbi:SKP1-like protein 20 isoform X2 [Daucus carota subsp. sativus]|uniref:SKP1-like protein 20 isoform X2 n=1 Tax=Daucus carota subsp. sativus TaxID=79200 RepID=UPI0007EFDCD7|nr:PREDICTED: SKP1-like protein 20 isoform X2 [Daucus carota subsp. sativus]